MNNGPVFALPTFTASHEEIPQSALSSTAPGLIPSRVTLKQSMNTYGSNTPGQLMNFVLPCGQGAGYLKSGSMYLYGTITVTTTGASQVWVGFNHDTSANSLIQRMIFYWQGQIADVVMNYNRNHKHLSANCSNAMYENNDLAVLSFKNQQRVTVGNTAIIKFCIPIKLSCFNAPQDLPLFLPSHCNLEIQTDTIASSLRVSGEGVSNYVFSDLRLNYEVFNTTVDFENSVRSVLQSGKMYQIPITSWYNSMNPNAGALKSVPINFKAQSILGVFWYAETDNGGAVSPLYSHVMTSDGANSNIRLFIDGELKTPFNIDKTPIIFSEKARAYGCLADIERSSAYDITYVAGEVGTPLPLTQARFLSKNFTGGLSLIRSQESGFTQQGTSCNSQMLLEVTNAGSAGSLYWFVAYSQVMLIDGQGTLQVIR